MTPLHPTCQPLTPPEPADVREPLTVGAPDAVHVYAYEVIGRPPVFAGAVNPSVNSLPNEPPGRERVTAVGGPGWPVATTAPVVADGP
jgi:hypothetical protein